jgi:hypothetical protein
VRSRETRETGWRETQRAQGTATPCGPCTVGRAGSDARRRSQPSHPITSSISAQRSVIRLRLCQSVGLCACCGRVRTALATHTYCARTEEAPRAGRPPTREGGGRSGETRPVPSVDCALWSRRALRAAPARIAARGTPPRLRCALVAASFAGARVNFLRRVILDSRAATSEVSTFCQFLTDRGARSRTVRSRASLGAARHSLHILQPKSEIAGMDNHPNAPSCSQAARWKACQCIPIARPDPSH